jgi:ribulose-phosphate 3-epimerase
MDAHIHPSILSADFVNFERDFATISESDAIHVDVMDGHFVPNLTFGLPMVRRKPIDVHLMIENVDELAVGYAEAGAKSVTFHFEATTDAVELARRIRAAGSKAAVAIKPNTPVEAVLDIVHEFDMILVMTVEPGFGGQKFMSDMLTKVEQLAQVIREQNFPVRIQIDGGVDLTNITTSAKAGADTFVAGSCVFGSTDRNGTIRQLRQLAEQAAIH